MLFRKGIDALRTGIIAAITGGLLSLAACASDGEVATTLPDIDLQTPVNPASYEGDVQFRIAQSFRAREKDIPFALYLGLFDKGDTRLGTNAFVDLRGLQVALPELLTGKLSPACNLDLDITFGRAVAEGEAIRAQALVKATLYRCRDRGTPDEERGWRIISQDIGVDATVSGGLQGDCIALRMEDLELQPRGVIGRIATLFGLTERARVAIVDAAGKAFAEHPVCPEFPPPLAALEPRLDTLGIRETGEGGIGAALSGSADINADHLTEALSWVADKQAGGAGDGATFHFDGSVAVKDTEIAYAADARLTPVAATRMGMETVIDLRDIQRRLPDLLAGRALIDNCGGRITLEQFDIEASGSSVIAKGRLDAENYTCERTQDDTWQRGDLEDTKQVDVRAEASADLVDNCVVFRLLDLTRDPPGLIGRIQTESGRLEAARVLLLEAVGLVLEEAALCPTLPPEIAVLDPKLETGHPHEIGDGGLGVAIEGSVDTSPRTVVALLDLLQERGVLPPAP